MQGYHLHITGRVQGVGFRPFVYQLATAMGLYGQVSNGISGVHIYFNTDEESADIFKDRILKECPDLAIIEQAELSEVTNEELEDFSIVESSGTGKTKLKVSPDFAICKTCSTELNTPGNPREGYAFITCTLCGPRYSVMDHLPYDRENTSMSAFTMCKACAEEYEQVTDRRYYSQTNSCPNCGVKMSLYKDGEIVPQLNQSEVIDATVDALKNGQIVAVKGVGGYLLLCDAQSDEAVSLLRERKNRPDKPFAVMYPDASSMRQDVELNSEALGLLQSPESPIVLLPSKSRAVVSDLVAPQLSKLGVMLPYAPLFQLIAKNFDEPLVATSANLSGSPIIYQDDIAIKELPRFADLILTYNREIVTPQDDSVVRLVDGKTILMRRSRGYAPAYYGPRFQFSEPVLALGAHMKSSIAIGYEEECQISQYLGDLSGFESQEMYQKTLGHFLRLFNFEAKTVLTDAHPAYFNSSLNKELTEGYGDQVITIQHHKAHFAAVLQENDLLENELPVLGVIWDGTVWGDDQQIWGGEFFIYDQYEISRIAHLNYTPSLSASKMAREPRLSALSFLGTHPEISERLKDKFTETEWQFFQKQIIRPTISTSSIGRLFDAMASVLDLVDKQTYEGQGAILVEELADTCDAEVTSYSFRLQRGEVLLDVFQDELSADLFSGLGRAEIALKFHKGLVSLVAQVAFTQGMRDIAFSGGVFQNALLTRLLQEQLGSEFRLHFHKELPPNDENISFGQLAYFFIEQRRRYFLNQNKVEYVFSNSR